ncbi:hypothetical protein HO133_005072 [Letharia lupina]|uniref:Uncharacterized protein n=1 Tax=Letharia lupina TaxID=560253 RepID=A0A8H6F8K0_9LECA|nr:uncharacterized protein HO133_005072 [Letharia lupina]KAF6219247.1 hypothetical protein HO133_005072 [Letharia lupina]
MTGFASPLASSQGLAERDNKWNLKCGNAPTVVAGSLLNASDVTNPLPQVLPDSGSNQPWLKYLWCIPGTQTYLFLNNGRLLPPPLTYRDVRGALSQAAVQAQNNLTQHGDGPITGHYSGFMTPGFNWYMTPPATNFQVYAQSSKGVLTWSVLVAALKGLGQYVNNTYDFGDVPIVFQINDGQWGEVGIGYVGFIDPDDPQEKCIYELVWGKEGYCEDVTAGKVIN